MAGDTTTVLDELERILAEVQSVIGELGSTNLGSTTEAQRLSHARDVACSMENELQSLSERISGSGTPSAQICTNASPPLEHCLNELIPHSKALFVQVTTTEEVGFLKFSDGLLIDAISEQTPQHLRLGEVLVAMGALTREALEESLADPGRGRSRLGDYLLQNGYVTARHLEIALQYQRYQTLQRFAQAGVIKLNITT